MTRTKHLALLTITCAITACLALLLSGCIVIQTGGGTSGSDSSSNTSAQSSASSTSSSQPSDMQRVGSKPTGYVEIPANWEDMTNVLDQNLVDSADVSLGADPDSEYTSATFSHFEFARSVRLSVYPTDYQTYAGQILSTYGSKPDVYSEITSEPTTFKSHDAMIITAFVPDDGIYISSTVFNRDGDGTATVVIETHYTESSYDEVAPISETWSLT